MSRHLVDRMRCRACGIAAPDAGWTVDGDVLCDECEQTLCAILGRLRTPRPGRVTAIPHQASPAVLEYIRAKFAEARR